MSGSSPRGVRTRRAIVLVLVLAAVAVGFRLWWNQHQVQEHKAAVATPVPSELATQTQDPSSAGSPSPVVEESSSAARKSQPNSPATTPTHPAPVVKPLNCPPYTAHPPKQACHLFIPVIGVNTTVGAKPSSSQWDEFLGKYVESFGVPPDSDMYQTTWWSANSQGTHEPRPGDPGMAIILGHTQIGAYGVFNKLGELKPGQVAGVSNGHITLKFEVITVKSGIPKTDGSALNRVLNNHPRAARLALITCSGHFNGRESVENTVVFLRLVGAS